jgi:spore germination cell wall hydrolase CwlJ-like protein
MIETYTLVLIAIMVCREAAFEPQNTKLAVAQTVMNRADHPNWWGRDPEGVVTMPFQYSTMTAPGDRQLTYWPTTRGVTLQSCLEAAKDALTRKSPMVVKGADSFYADGIKPPKWATDKTFIAKLGPISFYNTDGK